MRDLVSILIPAYNAERWIATTLESAIAQTWPTTEIIVVDDGSRDNTLAVSRGFENRRVKVVTQENSGSVAARNTAFRYAQGAYIQWLDADDLLHPSKIERQMRVARDLADPRRLLAGPFGTFYFRPERALFEESALWTDLSPVDYFLIRFRDNAWLQTSCWLASRELAEVAGPWRDSGLPGQPTGADDDGEYFARMMTKSTGMTFVGDARVYYRVGNFRSVGNGRSHAALTALIRSKIKTVQYLLLIEDSPRTRTAGIRFMQAMFCYIYPEHPDLIAEAQEFAATLGGNLYQPPLKWKYRPAEWLLGYSKAAKLSRDLPNFRISATRAVDRLRSVSTRSR